MKLLKTLILLVAILGLTVGALNAAYYSVTLRDQSLATRTKVLEKDPTYPLNPPTANRWVIQAFVSTDAVIDPWDNVNKVPTGDDVMVTSSLNTNASSGLWFVPTGPSAGWWTGVALRVYDDGQGDVQAGEYLYYRIFNATTIAAADSWIEYTRPYLVPTSFTVADIIVGQDPVYAWLGWLPAGPEPITYTLNIAIDDTASPGGTYTINGNPYQAQLVDNDDEVNDLIGFYDISDAPAGYHWAVDPIEVIATDFDGNIANITFLLVADPDTYQYKLTLHAPDDGAYAYTGPADDTTGVEMVSAILNEAVNPYLGTYTITAPCPVDYYEWLPLEVLAGDFALQTKGKNGAAFGQRANGSKALLVYVGEKDFAMQAIDYTFEFTGLPAGATINGGTVFTFTGTAAELFAMTFDILAPGFEPILGYVITPATLLDGGDEIVMDPIVDTWTLNVISTPEGQEIWKNNVYTGFVTPHAFTNEDQTALYGTYTLPVVAGFVWCPLEHIVNVDTWNTKADYPATIEFLQQQIYTWTVLVLDLNTSLPIEGASIWFDDGVNPPTVVATTIVNGTYTFTCPGDYPGAGTYYVTAAGYNIWDPINVVQTVETMTENLQNSTFYGDWEYVPVELSSFTATLTGQFYVQLSWTSQTETQMMGYRVYRNTSAQQSSSELIDNPMIPATNTSSTQNYTVVDDDVLIGQTYYYWLEAVDYNSSEFHGPVSVTVTGNVPPVLPEVTEMRNAYPNPFKANGSTNIEVSLKAGETGTLTIYNVQGQAVKTVSLTEGNHMVNWNGRDSRGNACGSGIYFYKLSTQSMNQTKKMVIVK